MEPNQRSERVLRIGPSVFLFLALLAGLGYAAYHFRHLLFVEKPPVTTSLGPTISQVERLGQLTVMRISVSDVLKMTGYNYKGAFLIKGDGLIAVDMRKLKLLDRNDDQKLVTIVLPEPEIVQPRVDHNKTMTYDVKGDWFSVIPGWGNESKLRDAAMLEAQKLVEHAVNQPEYIKQAKNNAELMLQNMFGFTGWYITIKWESELPKVAAAETAATAKAANSPAQEPVSSPVETNSGTR